MSSAPAYVSSEQVWDPRLNAFVEQITYVDYTGSFTPPSSGVMEYSVTYSPGEARHTWRQYASGLGGDGTAATPPGSPGVVCTGIVTPEPLITHPLFQTGTYALTEKDKTAISQAEADPKQFVALATQTESAGLALYAQKRLKGQDSYLIPSVNIQTVADETSFPDLSNVGKIGSPQGNIPALGGRTFLLVGAQADPVAPNMWRVTREWRGSGPQGWSQDLYGTTGTGSGTGELS